MAHYESTQKKATIPNTEPLRKLAEPSNPGSTLFEDIKLDRSVVEKVSVAAGDQDKPSKPEKRGSGGAGKYCEFFIIPLYSQC